MEKDKDQLEEIKEQVLELKELVKYQPGSVVSRTLVDKDTVTLTLFAFDEEQTLSEHTSPHDAILQVLEGKARIIINDQKYELEGGKTIVMPANEPHAVEAVDKFKMFLMMVK